MAQARVYNAVAAKVAMRNAGARYRPRKRPLKGRGTVPTPVAARVGAAGFENTGGGGAGRPFSQIPTFQARGLSTRYFIA